MERKVEFLDSAGNYHLVQIAGRAYPSLAIQGDSLKVLYEAVVELVAGVPADGSDVSFAAREVEETVQSMIAAFEEMSLRVGKNLPYRA